MTLLKSSLPAAILASSRNLSLLINGLIKVSMHLLLREKARLMKQFEGIHIILSNISKGLPFFSGTLQFKQEEFVI